MKNNKNYLDISLIQHIKNLFPICRSITGEGTRKTLHYFENYHKEYKRLKFKTGTKVLDWEIPKEWNIKDAYIEHLESGKRYAEFKKNNLHIVGYSEPISRNIKLLDLQKKIYTHPKNDKWIPYVTTYYKKDWGFCMQKKEKDNLKDGLYKVFINSSLTPGYLDLSHAYLPGKSKKEILLSTYVCHPSMANDQLSGPVVLNALLEYIKIKYPSRKFSYRFIMQPETIGSIAYISKYKKELKKNVICGFNLSCLGDERAFSYVNTPFKDTLADKALKAALINKQNVKVYSYLDRGSDERQYCSPRLRLPICLFSKSKVGKYPEYHSSADNLNLVTNKGLEDSFEILKTILDAFEKNLFPIVKMIGEPQLGKRGLYPNISKLRDKFPAKNRMDFLSYCDGETNIFDICEIINCNLFDILKEYDLLKSNDLID